jgi:energy-coupling factor transporter ATP-binding protein EcfA2
MVGHNGEFSLRMLGYQALQDATVVVEGVTVVTGPTNRGKSSLVRALWGLLTNQKGTRVVRTGAAGARVEVTLGGHTVVWEKGSRGTRYVIDGSPYEHAGVARPQGVEVLGILPLGVNGEEVWPQIQRQHGDRPFLVGETNPVVVADLLLADRTAEVYRAAARIAQGDAQALAHDAQRDGDRVAGLWRRLTRLGEVQEALQAAQTRARDAVTVWEATRVRRLALEGLVGPLQRLGRFLGAARRVPRVEVPHPVRGTRICRLLVPPPPAVPPPRGVSRAALVGRSLAGLREIQGELDGLREAVGRLDEAQILVTARLHRVLRGSRCPTCLGGAGSVFGGSGVGRNGFEISGGR